MLSLGNPSSIKKPLLVPLFLLCNLLATAIQAQIINVGDVFCIEGYVMDRYCIDNVRLLDNPREETLKRPE
jgi:hypothetical protein